MVSPGDCVVLHRHAAGGRVGPLLGSGGQGTVHRVTVLGPDGGGRELALKWYHPQWATRGQFEALRALVDQGPPNHRFLWPIDVATAPTCSGFGYLMPLRGKGYVPCLDVMRGRAELTFRSAVQACLHLAECFLTLHAQGLCYRDISFGNAFVEPATGEVLVADNDNVAFQGRARPGIKGTRAFMAPEVMCRNVHPSAATDLYSLSVLIFYLLVMHHPLEGSRLGRLGVLGAPEAAVVYGTSPVFIFDPDDQSNAADPDHDANAVRLWPLYPAMVRRLFVQAFTVGLHHPEQRVRESQWRDVLAQSLDLIVPCHCGTERFIEAEGGAIGGCWDCTSPDGDRLEVGRLVLDAASGPWVSALYPGKELRAHHLGGERSADGFPRARVERHPDDATVVGLRNLGERDWLATTAAGPVVVTPGRTVRLEAGTILDFGRITGTVVG